MAWSAASGPPGAKRAVDARGGGVLDLAGAGAAVEDHRDRDVGADQRGQLGHQSATGAGAVAPPAVGARPDEVHAVDHPVHGNPPHPS